MLNKRPVIPESGNNADVFSCAKACGGLRGGERTAKHVTGAGEPTKLITKLITATICAPSPPIPNYRVSTICSSSDMQITNRPTPLRNLPKPWKPPRIRRMIHTAKVVVCFVSRAIGGMFAPETLLFCRPTTNLTYHSATTPPFLQPYPPPYYLSLSLTTFPTHSYPSLFPITSPTQTLFFPLFPNNHSCSFPTPSLTFSCSATTTSLPPPFPTFHTTSPPPSLPLSPRPFPSTPSPPQPTPSLHPPYPFHNVSNPALFHIIHEFRRPNTNNGSGP